MADRLNDTDPQSPSARSSPNSPRKQEQTDPGLGEPPPHISGKPSPLDASPAPPPLVPTPSPGTASIEELLDGITGPRPPPSRRPSFTPPSTRAYSAARPAPTPTPMPPHEPAVVSPVDEGKTVPRRGLEPASMRPMTRKIAEVSTVYTGKRAILRNTAVVAASAAVATLMLTSVLRWRRAMQPKHAAAVVVAAPETETPPEPAREPVKTVSVDSLPSAVPAPVASAASVPAAPSASAAPAPKPTASAPPKRAKPAPKAPPPGSLDDLNREIRH